MQQRATVDELELHERTAVTPLWDEYRASGKLAGLSVPLGLRRLTAQLEGCAAAQVLFAGEIALAERLQHPNLPRVYLPGPDAPKGLLLLEPPSGADLGNVVLRNPWGLDWPKALAILAQLATTLTFVHGLRDDDDRPLGLCGGELDPARVFVTPEGVVKLTGVGLAQCRAWSERRGFGQESDLAQLGRLGYLLLFGRMALRSMSGSVTHPRRLGEPMPKKLEQLVYRLAIGSSAEGGMAAIGARLSRWCAELSREEIDLRPLGAQPSSRAGSSRTRGGRFPGFHVVQKLGEGGMAEVYRALAWDEHNRPFDVVLKHLRKELRRDAKMIEMFRREAALAMRLDHPNVVRVRALEHGSAGEFQVMEYIDGIDLLTLLNLRGRPIHWPVALAIGAKVARGLAHAHSLTDEGGRPLELVHRDVSHANVMITRAGEVKLLDFGIAKTLSASSARTATGVLKGKLGYMAPEQLAGEHVTQRADQYALGVMLYELIWGRRVFAHCQRRHFADLLRERQEPVPPLRMRVDVPPWAEAVIAQLLEPDPEQRFDSCERVAEAIESRLWPLPGPETLMALLAEARGPRDDTEISRAP